MITNLVLFIILLDFTIVLVTCLGFNYTIYSIKKKKFKLIPRDYGLLGMYFTYMLFTLLSFVVEYSIYIHMKLHIPQSLLLWVLIMRSVHMIFTILAIAWSSGYKFGGTQKSGI